MTSSVISAPVENSVERTEPVRPPSDVRSYTWSQEVQQPEETLIADARAAMRPSQVVEGKLLRMMNSNPVLCYSHMLSAAKTRRCHQ